MRDLRFGRLLRAAIGSIVALEGTTAPLIEAEFGEQIGLSPASIQRYKTGHIPPDPRTVALLATVGVQRGCLNTEWLRAFLRAARYYNAAALLDQLAPMPASDSVGTVASSIPVHNLPAPTYTQFVARQAYGDVLDGLRQRTAVVLLVGMGGMGKTSLAREIADQCLQGRSGLPLFAAVVWVSDQDHPGATTLDTLLTTVARTLDYPGLLQLDQGNRREAVEQLLRRQRVLLVLDQCETITDEALLAWLPRLPEPSKALLTSRVEWPKLRQSCWTVPLRQLTADETSLFLAQQIRALKLEERVCDLRQLDELCAATGSNPKALALALGALRYGGQTLQQVLADIRTSEGEVVDAVLARSWALLEGESQLMLSVAPLFHGTINPEALAAAAGLEKAAAAQAIAHLTEGALLDVQQYALDQPPRYALHPLVRTFARRQLAAQPHLAQQARARQMDWYADLASTVGYCWDDHGRLAVLDSEQETLTALIHWGIHEDTGALIRLVRGVDYYYYIRGLWRQMPELEAVREAAARAEGNLAEGARALAYQLQMRCRQNQLADVEQRLGELWQLQQSTNLPPDVCFEVRYTIALYWTKREHYDVAVEAWEEMLPLARTLSVRAYAVNRGWLAICRYRSGHVEEAEALWTAVLDDTANGEFPRGSVSSQVGLARIALDRGDSARGHTLLVAAEHGAQIQGDRGIVGEIQTLLARYYELRGDTSAAREMQNTARDTFERLGIAREGAMLS